MSKKTSADETDVDPPAKARGYDERYLDNPANPRRRAGDAASAPVVPVPYPAMRYHVDGRTVTVPDAAADQALGDGWGDKPQVATDARAYPAWRYHASKPPVQVLNASDDVALGPGWYATVREAAASTV